MTSGSHRDFFERHYVRSLRYAVKKFPGLSRAEHEDIVQLAWERILGHLRRSGDGPLSERTEGYGEGWVMTTVYWTGLKWLRAMRTRAFIEGLLPRPAEVVPARHHRLGECLERLPARHLEVLLGVDVHGETHSEVADRLGVHRNTIGTLRTAALESLRTCLETSEP